uniref:Uncharacterized protein n=1 Tax=Anguilla anguilla TaxID=7936 RepID=A0A0E9W4Q2_ANGAN
MEIALYSVSAMVKLTVGFPFVFLKRETKQMYCTSTSFRGCS